MLLYRTDRGIGSGDGEMLDLLDVSYGDIAEFIAAGRDALDGAAVRERLRLSSVKLLAPVRPRGRIILNGLNYVDHVQEGAMRMPEAPVFLDIDDVGLCDPGTDILLPAESPDKVDYECELVLIVTQAGGNIPAEAAWQHIGGLTAGNDVSARDVQLAGIDEGRLVRLDQVRRGKTFPTFKPLGPSVLVTQDICLPLDLRLTTRVNGEIRQDARTSQMIFDIPTVIEHVSRQFRLEVGDIIFSGTPSGCAVGTGRYLMAGDRVEVSVESIGTLESRVVRR